MARGALVSKGFTAAAQSALTYGAMDLRALDVEGSQAEAINGARQIFGETHSAHGDYHAFLWQNGEMMDLGTLNDEPDAMTLPINEAGQIVGGVERTILPRRAVLWSPRASP